MPKLGVNIDHVATLRQARCEFDPDPLRAALICENAGAWSVVAHLREDRRHIQDKDIKNLKNTLKARLNLEMSLNKKIIHTACLVRPHQVTLVPERRQELTTEGGLDVVKHFQRIKEAAKRLYDKGIEISLFIDAQEKQIDKTIAAGLRTIELHTGQYATAKTKTIRERELARLKKAAQYAQKHGLIVNAGHGLNYANTEPIAQIPGIHELNIGHSIISHAVFVGLKRAVQEMMTLIEGKKQ